MATETLLLPPEGPEAPQLVWNNLSKGTAPLLPLPHPHSIVPCDSAADVQAAVRHALQHGLKVLPVSGGHHYGACFVRKGAVLLDLSAMTRIEVDAEKREARLQPGVKGAQLYDALAPHCLHFPGPHLSSVGCAGFILGGGNGFGSPRFGFGCDAVRRITLVEGRRGDVVTADARNNPELFWGLRGGGAFLGVVLEFEVDLFPLPPALPTGLTIYPASDQAGTAAALARWAARLARLPPELESAATLCCLEDGSPGLVFADTWYGDDGPAAQEVLREPQALGTPAMAPAMHCIESVAYRRAMQAVDPLYSLPGICLYGQVLYFRPEALTEPLLARVAAAYAAATSRHSLILLSHGPPPLGEGGALSAGQDSALSFRGSAIIGVYAIWARSRAGAQADGDAAHVRWARALVTELRPASCGKYLNETMFDGPWAAGVEGGGGAGHESREVADVEACFETGKLAQLRAVKAAWDPHGVFRAL